MERIVHLKIRPKGTLDKVTTFHKMAKTIDADWPFVSDAIEKVKKCKTCGGLVYARPILSPNDLKLLGRQAGLRKLRVDHYRPAEKCRGACE